MKLSTSLLIISWIPMLQLLLFRYEEGFIWFFLVSIVLAIIGLWLLIKSVPKDSKFLKKRKSFVFGFFLLFGIPVLSCISKIFEIELYYYSADYYYSVLSLIVTGISAFLLCGVIFLVLKEVQEEDKSYIPVLKFILAAIFLLWQLNMGFHLFYDLPIIMLAIAYRDKRPFYINAFANFQLLASVFYVTLNLLFLGWIFLKGKFKERQPLFFSSTGLLLTLGSFALFFVLFNCARLIPYNSLFPEHSILDLVLISISFTTVMGPVLMIAMVLVFLGGILFIEPQAIILNKPVSCQSSNEANRPKGNKKFFGGPGGDFSKKSLAAGGIFAKGMVIPLAAVIMYVFLFKTLWPFQDPSLGILFGVVKNRIERPVEEVSALYPAFYLEFHLYGKRAVRFLVNKLDDNEAFVRRLSTESLGIVGDERAVEPLIKTLEDRDKGVQRNAVVALARIKDTRAVKPLVEFLEKDDLHYDAYVMLWELGKWGEPRFIEPLLKKLDDDDEVLKESIVRALEYFKDARVIEKLIKQLKKEKSSAMKGHINNSLEEMTGQDYQRDEDKDAEWWQQWWDHNKEYFIKKWEKKNLTQPQNRNPKGE